MIVFGFGGQGRGDERFRDHPIDDVCGVHCAVAREAHALLAAARSWRESGDCARAQRKIREALQLVRRALGRHPESLFLSRFLCGIYFELRDFGAAEHCLEHLIAEPAFGEDADLTEAYTRLGIIKWYRGKDVSAALECFRRALEAVKEGTSPEVASEPHVHLARIYLELNDPHRACAHAEERLRIVHRCRQAAIIRELVSGPPDLASGVRAAI